MTPNDYQKAAARTESDKEVQFDSETQDTLEILLNDVVDAGEQIDRIKKDVFYKNAGNHEHPLSQREKRLLHASLGLITEAAELAEQTIRMLHNKEVDYVNVSEEIGDLLWYASLGATAAGMTLENVMFQNIEKLRRRFPEKFTSDAALDRDITTERETLEQHQQSFAPIPGGPHTVPDRAGMWYCCDTRSGHSMMRTRHWIEQSQVSSFKDTPGVHWEWDSLTNAMIRKAEEDLGQIAGPSRYGPGRKKDV